MSVRSCAEPRPIVIFALWTSRLRPLFTQLSDLSANAAAKELECRGVSTAYDGVWSAGKVIAIRKRLEASS